MPATNILANMFVTLYNTRGKKKRRMSCFTYIQIATDVLKTLQHHNYIGEFEHVDDKKGGKFKIQLLAKITKCGAITPRFKVKKGDYAKWEQQYLPSYSRGMLIVTTNQGVMSHHEASKSGLGGLLIGYVY